MQRKAGAQGIRHNSQMALYVTPPTLLKSTDGPDLSDLLSIIRYYYLKKKTIFISGRASAELIRSCGQRRRLWLGLYATATDLCRSVGMLGARNFHRVALCESTIRMRYLLSANMRVEDLQNFPKVADLRGDTCSSKETLPAVKYCMITPVRDEEECIAATIESVLRQTIRPMEWIIVDDGSTDATRTILDRYAREYSWIQILHRPNRGRRSTGGGIEAFIDAYSSLQSRDWEFLVNLDGDLTFDPDYFESCFRHFHRVPQLGIGGGTIYTREGEHFQEEKAPCFHVRGATKIYRRECWENLGGLVCSLGWDTIDEIKANQLGWRTQSFRDVQLRHHRLTGAAWGAWGNAVNDGEADYLVGYHPLFFWLKCIRHIFESPYLLRSLGIAYGFLRCLARRTPQITDGELKAYLRRQQLRRLFGMSSIWK